MVVMPYKGHRSVTIREEDYKYFWDLWQEQKEELMKRGVRSFGAFITRKLYEAIELDERQAQEP